MALLSQQAIRKSLASDHLASGLIKEYRWGSGSTGFICPRCVQAGKPGAAAGQMIRCRGCHTLVSPLSGSILDKTKAPESAVLWMAWALATRPGGLSAVEAARETGLSRAACHRILSVLRAEMTRQECDRVLLSSVVEADETFLGGEARDTNLRGRSHAKSCVLVIAERGVGAKCSLTLTPNAKATSLLPAIEKHVESGSKVITDGHKSYLGLPGKGYEHEAHNIRGSGVRAHELLPAVHQVAGTLKDYIYGTHKRTPKESLLPEYLGAFQWRYNRRGLEPYDAFQEMLDLIVGRKGGSS